MGNVEDAQQVALEACPEQQGVRSMDNRRMRADLAEVKREWDELNLMARESPDLMRIHRDGHCHEAVMWYVHHLPEVIRADLKDRIALPLLSRMQHDLSAPEVQVSFAAKQVHKSYK